MSVGDLGGGVGGVDVALRAEDGWEGAEVAG